MAAGVLALRFYINGLWDDGLWDDGLARPRGPGVTGRPVPATTHLGRSPRGLRLRLGHHGVDPLPVRTAVFRRRRRGHQRRRGHRRRRRWGHRGRRRWGLHHGGRSQRFLGHVDDRALEHGRGGLLGKGVLFGGHRGDPAALHSFRRSRHRNDGALGLQCRPLSQIGAEHDLKVGPQRRQFSAQRDHLIGRLSALFTGQLAA